MKMPSRKLLVTITILFSITKLDALCMDIELPFSMALAETEIETEHNYKDTVMLGFPIFIAGPARGLFLREPNQDSRWTIGFGPCFAVYPFQFIGGSANASFEMLKIKEKYSLNLVNTLDFGATGFFQTYFNTEQMKSINTYCLGPGLEYTLNVTFRSNAKFKGYIGVGPAIALSYIFEPYNNFYFFYGLNITAGVRLGSF